jgi:hypothetical protein
MTMPSLPRIPHRRVGDEELPAGGALVEDRGGAAGENAVDQAILDEDHAGRDDAAPGDADADEPSVDPVEIEVAQADLRTSVAAKLLNGMLMPLVPRKRIDANIS